MCGIVAPMVRRVSQAALGSGMVMLIPYSRGQSAQDCLLGASVGRAIPGEDRYPQPWRVAQVQRFRTISCSGAKKLPTELLPRAAPT